MSRSGYTDDAENLGLWRAAVASAIRGKRGQRLLLDMAEAMDAMPKKELIAGALEQDGSHCALGVVGAKRGIDLAEIDPGEPREVGSALDIAYALACEVAYINDECHWRETDADRWVRVRKWVAEQIQVPT